MQGPLAWCVLLWNGQPHHPFQGNADPESSCIGQWTPFAISSGNGSQALPKFYMLLVWNVFSWKVSPEWSLWFVVSQWPHLASILLILLSIQSLIPSALQIAFLHWFVCVRGHYVSPPNGRFPIDPPVFMDCVWPAVDTYQRPSALILYLLHFLMSSVRA